MLKENVAITKIQNPEKQFMRTNMCLGRCKVFDYMVNNLAVSISHSGGD